MYNFSIFSDNTCKKIQDLQKKCYGTCKPLSKIRKKYNTSIFGLSNIGVFAETPEGEVAAFYGIFPIVLTFEGSDFLVAQSGDTMTAPDHRGKGLFIELARETVSLAKAANIKLIFGFPNQNSFPGFKEKLRWEFVGNMQNFTIFVDCFFLFGLARKNRYLKKMIKYYAFLMALPYRVRPEDVDISSFFQKGVFGQVKKDIRFFQYKLRIKENALIKIDQFLVLLKIGENVIIGDVGRFSESKAGCFFKTMKKLGEKLGVNEIVFSLSKTHWLYNLLQKRYRPVETFPIGFFRMDDGIDIKNVSFTFADYDFF